MSGGVDSSVSAAILKEKGFDITGVFMKNWSGDDYGIQADCPWEQDQQDVEDVCKHLDIPFRSFNFEKEYRQKVVEYFFDEIRNGRTPNPDVMCNKEIKFKLFLEKSLDLGADMIATGHYAQNIYSETNKQFELHQGIDSNKDQSYFLHQITQEQLSKTLFPIGGLQKSEVRDLAKSYNLKTASKPDSQGICFIGEINVAQFLRSAIPQNSGDIIDIDTNIIVGQHDGISFYTIGQREGLKIGGSPKPYFVAKKDKNNNILYVAQGTDHNALYKSKVVFDDLHLINEYQKIPELECSASIRYRQLPHKGYLDVQHNIFTFDEPQRAIAEGQSIVFYNDTLCLGGGIIDYGE
jgi:tRNA-uridine 2-sulfurtransferase